tara:strand:- start:7839 stop:8900 length:1062 start_codon:yes stop_codon:yes gene_type:complete
MKDNPVLITGVAGFIGFHLAKKLIFQGTPVIGVDNINKYYDPKLKEARINQLKKIANDNKTFFDLVKTDIENKENIEKVFKGNNLYGTSIPLPKIIVNLAAQAGVRYSIENPDAYIKSNIVGFQNILEQCRKCKIDHFIYASSSSVYGGNTKIPFSELDNVDHPVSLYAATKKSNELVAHSYSHLYGIPSTGLRFFTVYGPWGRPDMALFLFTKAILNNEPINIFNNGEMIRDFTYIDDIIESLIRLIYKKPQPNTSFNTDIPEPGKSWAPYRIFNIGNSKPTNLMAYIQEIEDCLGIEAKKNFLPMQAGDVKITASNTMSLENWIKFKPSTPIADGVRQFVDWYKNFYKIIN